MENLTLYLTIGLGISLGVGTLIGWSIGKKSRQQPVEDTKPNGLKSYIRGLKYIIAHHPDKAIQEFTRAVQTNSNAVEIYQDLGNLFRDRGDINRAIHIHQSILLRPSLDKKWRLSTLMDLGEDYQKGGFSERAIKIYEEIIQSDPDNLEARKVLGKVFEQEKNWEKAYQIEKEIQNSHEGEKNTSKLAHLLTETGKEAYRKNDYAKAGKHLKDAIAMDKNCTEAYLVLGDIYLAQDKVAKAINILEEAVYIESKFPSAVYKFLEKAYLQKGKYEKIESVYQEILRLRPQEIKTRLILADYYYKKGLLRKAINELREGLKVSPESLHLRSNLAEMLIRENLPDEALKEYKYLVEQIKKEINYIYCQKCGYKSSDIQWKCPQCQEWDSFVTNKAQISI